MPMKAKPRFETSTGVYGEVGFSRSRMARVWEVWPASVWHVEDKKLTMMAAVDSAVTMLTHRWEVETGFLAFS